MKKIKLLFVINQLYKGGAETSLVNLLNDLNYSQYDVELIVLNQCPVKNAVSLIHKINNNVRICDAYKEYMNVTIADRVQAKLIYSMEQKGTYYLPALNFVRNKKYDWAFHIGEWSTPSFVAYEVEARVKAAWIHNDLSETEYFDADLYFYFADMVDYFIFVSKNSLKASVEKYPFLQKKAICIYNINDEKYIKKRAKEIPADFNYDNRFVLLTCANFRPQKNHMRQVKVLAELKRRGIEITWINIGATTDISLVSNVKSLCFSEGVDDNFKILGPRENPYQYIKRADAVAVLSDYESWSMVITEAKILGTPVISTKTSGALEQIINEKTGLLTDFEVQDIADNIERFVKEKELRDDIRKNTIGFNNKSEILASFNKLVTKGSTFNAKRSENTNRILYVIDDINYMGGAHVATKLQIQEFTKNGYDITIFSNSIPNLKVRMDLKDAKFLSIKGFRRDIIFNTRLLYCLTGKNYNKNEKVKKLEQVINLRLKRNSNYYEESIIPKISSLFSKYDTICVMSEGSIYREAAAMSSCKKKIQWIHTDYCNWREKGDWNKKITNKDGDIYKKFDKIVVLTEQIKNSFCILYPHLSEKIIVNKNLIPIDDIKKKAIISVKNQLPVHFVTVGRIDYQKAFPRLINILCELKNEGYSFRWRIIGGGNDFHKVKQLIEKNGLTDWVEMLGILDNPFPEIVKGEVFALLSNLEGIPNTIYEALVLGVPVLATDVGGVNTQIEHNVNGWLVDNSEKEIKKMIKYLLVHPEEITKIRENLKIYQYDNEKVLAINQSIFNSSN